LSQTKQLSTKHFFFLAELLLLDFFDFEEDFFLLELFYSKA